MDNYLFYCVFDFYSDNRRRLCVYFRAISAFVKKCQYKNQSVGTYSCTAGSIRIYRLVLQLFVTMTMLEDKNKILKKYETVLEGNEALVILSIIITVVIMQFVLLWYIKTMDYVFYDGLVYEKPVNMIKFNLEVLVIVLIFALIMWVIFCLVPMADTYYGFMFQSIFNWIIVIPVTIYLLHRLFTVWLDRSFDKIK